MKQLRGQLTVGKDGAKDGTSGKRAVKSLAALLLCVQRVVYFVQQHFPDVNPNCLHVVAGVSRSLPERQATAIRTACVSVHSAARLAQGM